VFADLFLMGHSLPGNEKSFLFIDTIGEGYLLSQCSVLSTLLSNFFYYPRYNIYYFSAPQNAAKFYRMNCGGGGKSVVPSGEF
jgi:hypothetical protein